MKKDIEYPASVEIKEKIDGVEHTVSMQVVIYYVGVYCPMSIDGNLVNQGGGHDHESFLKRYKRDIAKAKERGAEVKEGPMRSLKEELARASEKSGMKPAEATV